MLLQVSIELSSSSSTYQTLGWLPFFPVILAVSLLKFSLVDVESDESNQ